jgi:uncharacterized protein YbjT (DUF2867 family)
VSRIAITGGTGFVGGHAISVALAAGHEVAALARRPQPDAAGVRWIAGALDDESALARLVAGADAVLHIAGVVNAPDRDGFARGNVAGTAAIVAAAKAAGVARFVHVSSLAAREPALSDYGWSKREAEMVVDAAALDAVIVRPPAIYGPGDLQLLDMFRMAARGVVLLPPGGRLSVIAAADLARLLVALVTTRDTPRLIEADDGRPDGWSHRDFARAIGGAVGRRVVPLSLPQALLRLGAAIDGLARGANAKLTPDRVRYFCHPDWTVNPAARPPASLWTPAIPTPAGLAETAAWYRAQHLLG